MRLAVDNTGNPPSLNRLEVAQQVLRIAEAATPGASIIAAFRTDQRRVEAVCQKELTNVFADLGVRAAAVTASEGGLLLEATPRERVAAIIAALRLDEWIRNRFKPIFEVQWKRVADMTLMTLKRADVPVTMRSELERLIVRTGGTRVGLLDIAEETKQSLFRIIDLGREQGMNPRDVARLIQDQVPAGRFTEAGPKYRAQLIARTETLEAQRVSSLSMYKESPHIERVIAFDGDKDQECAERNGRTMSIEEAESFDPHPNCVLAFAPVV